MFPSDYGDLAEERRLAYVAITRGMRRVTISHCDYRRGPAAPSSFIDDSPDAHRADGWPRKPVAMQQRGRTRVDKPDAAALLRRF